MTGRFRLCRALHGCPETEGVAVNTREPGTWFRQLRGSGHADKWSRSAFCYLEGHTTTSYKNPSAVRTPGWAVQVLSGSSTMSSDAFFPRSPSSPRHSQPCHPVSSHHGRQCGFFLSPPASLCAALISLWSASTSSQADHFKTKSDPVPKSFWPRGTEACTVSPSQNLSPPVCSQHRTLTLPPFGLTAFPLENHIFIQRSN